MLKPPQWSVLGCDAAPKKQDAEHQEALKERTLDETSSWQSEDTPTPAHFFSAIYAFLTSLGGSGRGEKEVSSGVGSHFTLHELM